MDILNSLPEGNWKLNKQRIPLLAPESFPPKQQAILAGLRKASKAERNYNVFLILAKLGDGLSQYLPFFSNLLFAGKISRVDKEKIVLRVAWRVGCAYEWVHHTKLSMLLGISISEIKSMALEHSDNWTPRVSAFVHASDELLASTTLSDSTWEELREHLSDDEIVEFCFLVGHYVMVAMTINTSGIPVEPELLQSIA